MSAAESSRSSPRGRGSPGGLGVRSTIKQEQEVIVKREPQECAVCAVTRADCCPLAAVTTTAGSPLTHFLAKFTATDLLGPYHVCRTCTDLVNILEVAELEYLKLKEAFEEIISKNPLFSQPAPPAVKRESGGAPAEGADSDSEPLAVTRDKRRVGRRRKGPPPAKQKAKTKVSKKDRWKKGSKSEIAPVQFTELSLEYVKRENSLDESEGSQCYNGWDAELKLEVDEDSSYMPSPDEEEPSRLLPVSASVPVPVPVSTRGSGRRPARRTKEKVLHQCDQCPASYTTLRRVQLHRDKAHSTGRGPYICEVCGAKYKHKRACDIHVRLHSGISDWKCEECDKLFPSKAALQRHNNIHTGKLNYQCDQCGKSFIHTSSFKMHKLSHSGLKPHACDVCGLRLMTRSHLKRHARVHSGEKRYECAVCGKRFSERYNLLAHGKSHSVPPPGAAGAPPPPAAPRRRLFRCPFCPERYERRYMVERHAAVAHGRALERAPPTPRNTMSKLLKAKAAAALLPPEKEASTELGTKEPAPAGESGAGAGAGAGAGQVAGPGQAAGPGAGTATSAGDVTLTTWAGAFQAEFGLRGYSQ